ncbi:hypothetical protein [Paraburkholderia sp. C35]|uniref:hypothetical protein n=1 Tax=Paraburkholderia sp. C35 TaxID=2126993 RepID=UPI000D692898|nr:hypothetical protein [Paraburkholderia sp. C35]
MKVEEFLASEHFEPRTKISEFDAEIRLLRSRGVSARNIAKFLVLNSVPATKNGVVKYFLRHPERYSPNKKVARSQHRDASGPAALQEEPARSSQHEGDSTAEHLADSTKQESPKANAILPAEEPKPRVAPGNHSLTARDPMATIRPADPAEESRGREPGCENKGDLQEQPSDATNESENTRTFDTSGTTSVHYDRDTRVRTQLEPFEDERRVQGKIKHWDPYLPENQEAVREYVQGLKAGTIPTGVITNSEGQSNERKEDPDHP